MGYAIARAAAVAGATVTLVSGPTSLPAPPGVTVIPIETALQMQDAVERQTQHADAIIMAAAVADFRAALPSEQKIKKEPGVDRFELHLVRNPDIIAALDRPAIVKIGFAAETDNLLEFARQKLHAKKLAMIVANDAVASIGSDESALTLIRRGGAVEELPPMPKRESASIIVARIADMLGPAQKYHADGGEST